MLTRAGFRVNRTSTGIMMIGGAIFAAFTSLAVSASILSEGGSPALDTLVASVLVPGACLLLSGLAFLFAWNRSPKVASRLVLPVPILCILQLFFLLSGSYQYFGVTFGIGHLGVVVALTVVCGVLGAMAASALHARQLGMQMADVILEDSGRSPRAAEVPVSWTDADKLRSFWAARGRREARVYRRRSAETGIRMVGYPR
jgi:hypothetical protein